MTSPDGPGADVAETMKAMRDNAKRYGLVWDRAMATVVDGTNPGNVVVSFDGDDAGIVTVGVISMVGYLAPGERCYVDQVPPAGNYIVGRATGPFRDRRKLLATQAAVTFTGIPIALRSLQLRWRARSSDAAAFVNIRFRVNSDASALYNNEIDFAVGAAPSAGAETAATSGFAGDITGAGAAANRFSTGFCEFGAWDISGTVFGNSLGYNCVAQAMVSNNISTRSGGDYSGAGPYTSLMVIPSAGSFIAGSDFQLYGEPS